MPHPTPALDHAPDAGPARSRRRRPLAGVPDAARAALDRPRRSCLTRRRRAPAPRGYSSPGPAPVSASPSWRPRSARRWRRAASASPLSSPRSPGSTRIRANGATTTSCCAAAANAGQAPDAVAPYRFGPALSPHLAAEQAGVEIDPTRLVAAARGAASDRRRARRRGRRRADGPAHALVHDPRPRLASWPPAPDRGPSGPRHDQPLAAQRRGRARCAACGSPAS